MAEKKARRRRRGQRIRDWAAGTSARWWRQFVTWGEGFTIWSIPKGLLFWGSLIMVVVSPIFFRNQYSWENPADWVTVAKVGWLPLLAAMYLKFAEKFKRVRSSGKHSRKERHIHYLELMRAVQTLREEMNVRKSLSVDGVRRDLLQAVCYEVTEVLPGPRDDSLTATLLEPVASEDASRGVKSMRIVSRSSNARPVGEEYPKELVLAWESIESMRPAVVHNINKDPRWRGLSSRGYRSVWAVPIATKARDGENAVVAAISIDSVRKYAFFAEEMKSKCDFNHC